MTPYCEARAVTKTIKKRTVLRDVSLSLTAGEFVGLVGPNGAGKTTLLKHLCGLWVPTSGTVSIFGTPSLEIADHHLAELGYVPQKFDLPRLTRIEHLFALLRAFHPRWSREREGQLRELFSIDGKRWVGSISEGERQRVSLVAALSSCPRLLILDEPASALDPTARTDLFSYLRRIVSEEDACVVVSSHILADLERTADRIVFLREGAVTLDTSLDDLRDSRRRAVVRGPAAVVREVVEDPRVVVENKSDGTARVVVKVGDWEWLYSKVSEGGGVIEEHYLALDEVYPLLVAEGI